MANEIEVEYKQLLERRKLILSELPRLSSGYISKKVIRGKTYLYLQRRMSGKVTGRYIKSDEEKTVSDEIGRRRAYEAELPRVNARINELERASRLLGKGVARKMNMIKLSCGMDSLTQAQKKKSASFANALNAVEGVAVSQQTANEINDWQSGQKSYASVFKSVLQRYGFSTEE